MSSFLNNLVLFLFLGVVCLADEAVLVSTSVAENVYVKQYQINKGKIKYVDCFDLKGEAANSKYTVMNDPNACLAVSFEKQIATASAALNVASSIREIDRVVVEFKKFDDKSKVKLNDILKASSKWKKIEIMEANHFSLVFYVNQGKGCNLSDAHEIREMFVGRGIPESILTIVKNKQALGCSN